MCNLYSITTNQAAISALFRVVNRHVGNQKVRDVPETVSVVFKQLPRFDTEAICNPRHVVDRHIPFGTFDSAKIGPVQPTLMRKRLLAQTTHSPKPTHVLRQDIS